MWLMILLWFCLQNLKMLHDVHLFNTLSRRSRHTWWALVEVRYLCALVSHFIQLVVTVAAVVIVIAVAASVVTVVVDDFVNFAYSQFFCKCTGGWAYQNYSHINKLACSCWVYMSFQYSYSLTYKKLTCHGIAVVSCASMKCCYLARWHSTVTSAGSSGHGSERPIGITSVARPVIRTRPSTVRRLPTVGRSTTRRRAVVQYLPRWTTVQLSGLLHEVLSVL